MVDKVKKIAQGTAEWLALRVGKITGTRIQKAVGEDQFEKDLNYINGRFLLNKCIER